MRCFYPIVLKESQRVVPCGNCPACKIRRRSDWSLRLNEELRDSENNTFLTLTYNEKYLPFNGNLDKQQLVRYFKRVRKTEPKLKYYAVGEYGSDRLRSHYHAIVFNARQTTLLKEWRNIPTEKQPDDEELGTIRCDPVTEADIHYVTKYISDPKNHEVIDINPITGRKKYGNKLCQELGNEQPFSIMSKGIGKGYIKRTKDYHLKNLTRFTNLNGNKLCLPRYLQDKIFDSCKEILLEEENENLKLLNEKQLLKENIQRRIEVREYYKYLANYKSKSKDT